MPRRRISRFLPLVLLIAAAIPAQAQEPTDAERTQFELSNLMQRYPPGLRVVLSIDPSLLGNQAYLAPYPVLANFLTEHPEVARDPSFYFGEPFDPKRQQANRESAEAREAIRTVFILAGFVTALGLAVWQIRTLIDHRRWTRLNQIQTEAHSRILDRLSSNEELLAYIQSPAGSKFLESAPIRLDAAPRGAASPMNRVIWTIQAGIVMAAGGAGFLFVSSNAPRDVARALYALGILAIALGVGFVVSAIISFVISRRFGLIEMPSRTQE